MSAMLSVSARSSLRTTRNWQGCSENAAPGLRAGPCRESERPRKIMSYSLILPVVTETQRGKQLQRHQLLSPGGPAAAGWDAGTSLRVARSLPGETCGRGLNCGEVGHRAGWLSRATGFTLSSALCYPERATW